MEQRTEHGNGRRLREGATVESASNRTVAARWWLDRTKIRRLVDGVFEGGGAKGILYVGALQGVLQQGLWFSGVAGSSAGAITAALIAAGLNPNELAAATAKGTQSMALPKTLNGLRRVRRGVGFLDHEAVRSWVRGELVAQSGRMGMELSGDEPTFAELFEMTGIDLYVAAVDLRERQLMVFNHTLTPDCLVASAVMASATIPVAFEVPIFGTPEDMPQSSLPALRLVADGGIASNFPDFVFRDAAFRAFAGLEPRQEGTPLVGFVLEEREHLDETEVLDLYRRGSFLGTWTHLDPIHGPDGLNEPVNRKVPRFRARSETNDAGGSLRSIRRAVGRVMSALETAVLQPLIWLATAFGEQVWPWSWPEPKNRHVRLWATSFRRWLATAPVPMLIGIAAYTAMFWIGFLVVAAWLTPNPWTYPFDGIGSVLGFILGVLLTLAALALSIWVWLLGLAMFALLRVAYRTLGLIGYPLVRTFLQTPAAPPWAGRGPHETLVRLRVPDGVTTLGVSPELDPAEMWTNARETTVMELEGVV